MNQLLLLGELFGEELPPVAIIEEVIHATLLLPFLLLSLHELGHGSLVCAKPELFPHEVLYPTRWLHHDIDSANCLHELLTQRCRLL